MQVTIRENQCQIVASASHTNSSKNPLHSAAQTKILGMHGYKYDNIIMLIIAQLQLL